MVLYPVGQVVCVKLRCSKRQFRFCLGVVFADPALKKTTNTRLVSVHWGESLVWDQRTNGDPVEWFGAGLPVHDTTRLLIARSAAATFLQAFARGEVLRERRLYRVALPNICLPVPATLIQKIFTCS